MYTPESATDQDVVDAGDGDDYVWGGRGADYLMGGAGADHLAGLGGADVILGGEGADVIYGDEWSRMRMSAVQGLSLHGSVWNYQFNSCLRTASLRKRHKTHKNTLPRSAANAKRCPCAA